MKNKKTIIIFVLVLIVSNILSFSASNYLAVSANDKVIIPSTEYKILKEVYENNKKVVQVRRAIDELYLRDFDENDLLEGQLKGMVNALNDPYSVYMTKDEYERFNTETEGEYGGIGIIVTPGDDNLITVVSPIEDTPAEKAGIQTGDKIIRVDGKEYFAENMDEAVKVMRGEPNTDVVLTILRKDKSGETITFDVEITRKIIKLISVKSELLDDDIGYIRITSFDMNTADDFKKQLKDLERNNAKGLIIDLRNNPGGLLNVCADVADELLDKGVIVYTEDKNGNREYLYSDSNMTKLPIVVLVNEGSASASEILAGAIKDHQRGVLVGTTTFGKGVVQRLRDFPDGSGLKITVSEYFTPNGINIHGIGITPDVVVELNEEVEEIGIGNLENDNQLQKAIEVLKGKMN
ncbi:MAG: S41 family peptidase [Tissierellales bacterium]|nr:S41 family peptidase [Tissierellales bacterium]